MVIVELEISCNLFQELNTDYVLFYESSGFVFEFYQYHDSRMC